MKIRKILLFFAISLFIITTFITYNNFVKIYNNKIKPFNNLNNEYIKLKNKNKKINSLITKEELKSKENDETIIKNNKKREELEKVIYEHERLNGKIIYLTFDDGPSIYTDEILNILDKYNIKATFFVVCSNSLSEYSKKYVEKGHTIGLHACSHKYSYIYSSKDTYFNDLNTLSNIIETSSGYKSKYVRFPGGSSNTVSRFNRGIMSQLAQDLKNMGYKYYDWNIDSNDAGGADSNQIYSNVIGALQNNDRDVSIILMHDTKPNTKAVLEKIIVDALDMGYTFGNINDYTPEVHHYINN